MADNVAVTPGSGATIAADELTDGTLGSVKVQYIKIMDGTLDSSVKTTVKAASTAAAATDPALVVSVSPNSPVTISSSQIAALQTTPQPMATSYQLVGTPTDQVVANKLQAQTNGATSSRVVAGASTNATSLKGSAGAVIEIDVFNVAAYDVFLKIYNKASAPTVGTDTPTWTIPLKAGTGYSRDFKYGKWLGTGVAYAITKLQADSDTTVLVAGDVTGTIDWI